MESIIALLISALIAVESEGLPDAVGDSGRAVGILQITPVCVQDINRFARTDYTLEDRASESRSVEMCWRYLYHYGNQYKKRTGKKPTAEVLARIWNGGPRGYMMESTRHYWEKVQAEIQRQEQARQDGRRLSAHRRVITHSAWHGTRTYHRKRHNKKNIGVRNCYG